MVLFGGLLALVTWLAAAIVLIAAGSAFIRRNFPKHPLNTAQLITAVWWGLGIMTLLGYLLAFFIPLRSTISGLTVLAVTVILGAIGWRGAMRVGFTPPRWSKSTVALAAALALVAGYLALAVLGPVTHYDAGLYQWAAVQYAGDYAVIPGLANLYGPLGYASAEPVLGALLGATPWQTEGFRLLGGVFVLLLGLEALARTLSRPRDAGTAIALVGTALVFPPMIWMADFWVVSPTPDLPVLVLAIVAAAYLADLVTGKHTPNALPTIVVLAALMTALRPTAAALAGTLVITAALVAWRRRTGGRGLIVAAAVLTAALAVTVFARDRMLSGWLPYPLSVNAFDVPWRAPDPEGLRTATLGFARDPENWQEASSGWEWVGPWFARLPQQWEPWWLLAALIAAVALLVTAGTVSTRPRALLAVMAPYLLATATWWLLGPPALRFGWGPLFGITAILLGWGLWRRRLQIPVTYALAVGIAAITLVAAVIRLDWTSPRETQSWLGIPYSVIPLPTASTSEFVTDSGLILRMPTDTDQCWAVYPMCTPDPMPSLEFIGEGITSGFVS